MNTIWFIPVSVLLAASLVILLIRRGRSNIGAAWFAAVIAALIIWGWTVSLYWQAGMAGRIADPGSEPAAELVTGTVFNSGIEGSPLTLLTSGLVLDAVSYPYMLAVSALLVVLLLTAPSYMEPQTAPRLWFFYLLIELIGFLAVSAAGVLPVIYCWVIFDAVDLLTQYIQTRPGGIRRSFMTAVGARFIGTLLAASSLALSSSELSSGGAPFISPDAAPFLLLACALRMGILPISQPYSEMSSSRVGLGTMLRLVSVLTVMPVLSRIPYSAIGPDIKALLSIAGGFASLTGAVGWMLSESASAGNSYAAMAMCGMAFVSALSGDPKAPIVWGVSVVLTCAPLSLYQIHNAYMNILASLLIICFSGLPYTPNAAGWNGLIGRPYSLKDLLFIIVSIFLTGGAFIHIFRTEGKKFSELEPWMRSVYPLGFLAAIGTHVFISLISNERGYSLGVIPASVTAFVGGILTFVLTRRLPQNLRTQNVAAWGREGISLFWRMMKKLLDMEWLISVGLSVARAARRLTFVISYVLENNSGLVWEFLLLALIIAVAFTGGLA